MKDDSKQIAPTVRDDGMTLREYYAGLAMAAFISIPDWNGCIGDAAHYAVDAADALLAELEK
jgi:hypothetical protein